MATELTRDLHVLMSIAKLDAAINDCRTELARLPAQVEKRQKSLSGIESHEAEAKSNLDELAKERRTLEQALEDNANKVTKYKTQLMEVKTNKEYTAMLHEIEHIENDTGEKEERLLILMDELDQRTDENTQENEEGAKVKKELKEEQARLETRVKELEAEVERLQSEKPKLLHELNARIKKRYERLLSKLGDFAVTNIEGETCQGCFTRIPPQTAVEVRKNEQLITCEGCGRMLVHY